MFVHYGLNWRGLSFVNCQQYGQHFSWIHDHKVLFHSFVYVQFILWISCFLIYSIIDSLGLHNIRWPMFTVSCFTVINIHLKLYFILIIAYRLCLELIGINYCLKLNKFMLQYHVPAYESLDCWRIFYINPIFVKF